MSTNPVSGGKTFHVAIIMSALWIGANSLVVLKAYEVETARKSKVESSFSVAQVYASAHLDKLAIL